MFFYWLIIPIANIVIPFICGIIYKLGKQISQTDQGTIFSQVTQQVGTGMSNFIGSSFFGDIWLLIFIVNIILGVSSFIYANYGEYKNKDYNLIGWSCVVSLVISLGIVCKYF